MSRGLLIAEDTMPKVCDPTVVPGTPKNRRVEDVVNLPSQLRRHCMINDGESKVLDEHSVYVRWKHNADIRQHRSNVTETKGRREKTLVLNHSLIVV